MLSAGVPVYLRMDDGDSICISGVFFGKRKWIFTSIFCEPLLMQNRFIILGELSRLLFNLSFTYDLRINFTASGLFALRSGRDSTRYGIPHVHII